MTNDQKPDYLKIAKAILEFGVKIFFLLFVLLAIRSCF